MAKYDLVYTVCNGNFLMDVRTGYCILAKNKETAMQAAGRLDKILSEKFDLRCYFDLKPNPHIVVHGLDKLHQHETQPTILCFQVQKNFDSPRKLLGYPVFSENDFTSVTETDFIKSLINEYSNRMEATHKTRITFECISYGIEKYYELK